jgi:hypothetical protein
MLNFVKRFTVLSASVVFVSLAAADSNDYRAASHTAFRLASAHSDLGETAAACAALSQSLEQYRKALAMETGIGEAAESSINDESDGMAEVRAKFGCPRA